MILENGLIRTMDASLPTARALAIADTRIAGGVGVHETALASPETVDLGGRCVLPAFTDSHVHFPTWSLAQQQVKLDGCTSIEEALSRVKLAEAPAGRWLRGYGWRAGDWSPSVEPTKEVLDEATGGTADDPDLEGLPLRLAQLRGARRRRRRPAGGRRRRRARPTRGADGNPARGIRLAIPRPVRPHLDGRVGRGDATRPQAGELARRRRHPRQGRLAGVTRHLPAPGRRGEPDAAGLGLDPGRAASTTRQSSPCAPASATTTCASAT